MQEWEQHWTRSSEIRQHSLRRSADLPENWDLRAVQLLLDHLKIESAVRYLGIEVDDAITIAKKIDIRSLMQLGSTDVVGDEKLSPISVSSTAAFGKASTERRLSGRSF